MAERTLAILVTAKNLASKTLRAVSGDIDKLQRRASKGFGTAAANVGKLAIATAGLATVMTVGAVKAAGDFEAQLNTINTVAARSPAELEKVGQGIRQIARDTGTPLEELTQGFYDLVSAGVAADQAQRVLASSNRLAIGGLASAAEGVDLITTALNSYGIEASKQGAMSERFADVFAKAIERGKVTAADLAATFSKVGPLAAKMGVEIEEIAAAYASLTAKGVPAAEAATQVSSAMVALIRKTGPLEKLEKATKRNYAAIAGKQGLAVAYEQMRIDAEKAGVPIIELVGRQEALQFQLNATGDSLTSYNANLDAMRKADGTAAKQMAERQKGLNFQLARLKALALDAGITIGSKLLPKITPLAERWVNFIAGNQEAIERFGDDLASAFDDAAAFASRIPWDQVGSGLKMAADWATKLMGVFMNLPPEAQATLVALAGLNKLSGGAVGSIAGELGKGLIKGVLGINAGVVHVNGPVAGGPGAVGGRGGAGLIAGILPAAAILAIGYTIGEGITQAMGGPTANTGGRGRPIAGTPFVFGQHQGALVREESARARERNAAQARGGLSPDDRQARNDLAKIGLQIQRQGERGGRAQSAVERTQLAVERFERSSSPSLKSIEAHEAQAKALLAATPARDASHTAQIVAAINRIGQIKVTVNSRTSASDNARANTDRRRTVKPHGSRGQLAAEFG